jgi:biopolymer transport protein ExbB
MGGPFMWPLLVFSIATCAIALERFVYLFSRNLKIESAGHKVISLCGQNHFFDALKYLESLKKNAPFAAVFLLALRQRHLPEKNLEKVLENETGALINKFETGFDFLTALGSLAPLTGFLGTVSGMIGAFKSIAEATEVNAQIVANGIYEALITTVFGLIIAIIAMVSHSLLSHFVDTFAVRLEKTTMDLLIVLKTEAATHQ